MTTAELEQAGKSASARSASMILKELVYRGAGKRACGDKLRAAIQEWIG
jgi:hypothetical protein